MSTDEMPPALDDASGGDVLRLHWSAPLPAPVYAQPVCCCPPQGKEELVVNAGCQVHGIKSYDTLRSSSTNRVYGLGR